MARESKNNVDEIIAIIHCVKLHLVERRCPHSIDFIVKEALDNKNRKAGLPAQQLRARPRTGAANGVINPNDYERIIQE